MAPRQRFEPGAESGGRIGSSPDPACRFQRRRNLDRCRRDPIAPPGRAGAPSIATERVMPRDPLRRNAGLKCRPFAIRITLAALVVMCWTPAVTPAQEA